MMVVEGHRWRLIIFFLPGDELSMEEAKNLIDKYNEEYKDATHVCYAYILDENTYKYYDDGEPASSAGMPIYQVLKNNKLIY